MTSTLKALARVLRAVAVLAMATAALPDLSVRWRATLLAAAAAAFTYQYLMVRYMHRIADPERAEKVAEQKELLEAVDAAIVQGDWVLLNRCRAFVTLMYTTHHATPAEDRWRHDSPAYNQTLRMFINRRFLGLPWEVVLHEHPAPWLPCETRTVSIAEAVRILADPTELQASTVE